MDVLVAAGRAIGRSLTLVAELKRNERSQVLRATTDDGTATVIVKAYEPEFAERWARESAALSVLQGRGLPVPELLAVATDPTLVVLADAGEGGSVADALLGRDAAAASGMLDSWAEGLAVLHAATAGDAALFTTALGAAAASAASATGVAAAGVAADGVASAAVASAAVASAGGASAGGAVSAGAAGVAGVGVEVVADPMPGMLGAAADLLATQLPALGVAPGSRALAELRSITDLLSPAAAALTPADACPDNNLATTSGLLLLDFERAAFRHVAWDAAYLLVPWPTCWCSWGLPDVVAGAALARWRRAVAPTIPAVAAPAFERDLDLAVVGWSVLTTAFLLAGAVERDESPGGPAFSPSRRAVIRHRMGLAARRRSVAPDVAELAEDVLAAIARHWGELPLAPAYR